MLKKFTKEYHIRLLIIIQVWGGGPKSRITGDIVADLQIGLQKDWLGWKNLSLQKMSVTVNKSSFCRMTILICECSFSKLRTTYPPDKFGKNNVKSKHD